jgi:FdhE protein
MKPAIIGGMMETLQTKLERIEELKLSKKAFKEIFEFFEKIFIEKEAVKGKIESFDNYPDQAGIQLRMKEGFPIADSGSFKPDTGALEKYFLTLLNIMAEKNSDEVKYIKDAIAGIDGGFKAFFEKLTAEDADEYISSFEKGRDLLVFIIKESLKPFLEKYCEGIKEEITEENFAGGSCPVCGSFPSMAELRGEEGKRYLVCPDCQMEWAYDRIKCPFCGIEEQKKIEYFTPEKESRYRVMLCKSCTHYLKVLDFREMEKPPVFEVEHLATLYLDVIAKKEGYETEDELVNLIV